MVSLLAIAQMVHLKAGFEAEAAPQPEGLVNSWPMLAANPQRTSWTADEVRGDLNVEWYRPLEPYIPYKIQPIAANGKVYVSTARGLYTFSAANGDLLWVFPTELPLGHSPTIATVNAKSVAFVGGFDRKIHALDANTGQAIAGYTPYEAGAGFETNPLVINDTIYAGNRDGYFYALNAVTGGLLWRYKTDGPILYSAAYKNGVLYFAANDTHAYALNAANGNLLWKSQKLPGSGFHSYWPVIYTEPASGKDYVIFSGGENYRFRLMNVVIEESDTVYTGLPDSQVIGPTSTAIPGDWAAGTFVINASILTNYYEDKPYRRTVFVLEANNGQEYTFDSDSDGKAEYAPFNWSGVTHSGSKYPPVVNGLDGVFYQATGYIAPGWISRGGPVGWKFGTPYISRVIAKDIAYASDEPLAYSSGGKLVYFALCCDREAGAVDVTIPYGQANRSWQYFGYNLANNVLAPGYQPTYNAGDPTAYDDENGWQLYSGNNQSSNSVYGKHGSAQSPPIPYQGKVYMLKGNALLAFSSSGTNPKTPLPLATIVPAQNSGTSPSKIELLQRLESEIQKIIAAGPLRPGYHDSGFIDLYGNGGYIDELTLGEIFDYFQNPADTVYTLLLAYPHLSPTTQQQIKSYLQTNYGPDSTYDFTKIAHVGWGTGAAREPFDIPPEVIASWGQPYTSPAEPSMQPVCGWCGYWEFPPFSFYAAWKYAQIIGANDPAFAKDIFDRMSGKLATPPNDNTLIAKPFWLNPFIAGYRGYLELQKLAGYPVDSNVQSTYQHLLNLRINNFSKNTPYPALGASLNPGSNWELSYHNTLAVARNFMLLTPELGAYLNQNLYGQVDQAINEYEAVAPYWFVPKFDASYGEGTFQHLYDSPALFQAKAYILKQPYDELVKWLDVPAFYQGDLFYIQNLVAALNVEPDFLLRSVPDAHHIKTGQSAAYSLQIQRFNNFSQTITLQIGSSPSADLQISPPAASSLVLSSDQTTLTITDQHDPSFKSPVSYSLPLTASGGGLTRTTVVFLSLNTSQSVFLPVIIKDGAGQ
jgi:outer membrane protein assembly factor BamB